jgi:chemotaxis protein histidine kinase CheA
MTVFFYNTKKRSTDNLNIDKVQKSVENTVNFRAIEELFLNKVGSDIKIIGFFLYFSRVPVKVIALSSFQIPIDRDYLIVTSDYPFDSPGFLKTNNFIEETIKSYKNFGNTSTASQNKSNYAFRTKTPGFFGKILEDYKLTLNDDLLNKLKTAFPSADNNSQKAEAAKAEAAKAEAAKAEAAKAEAAKAEAAKAEAAKAEAAKAEAAKAEAAKAEAAKAEEARKVEALKKQQTAEVLQSPKIQNITSQLSNIIGARRTVANRPALEPFVQYTEKQEQLLCGKHAINHILQEEKIVKVVGKNALIDKNTKQSMPQNTKETNPDAQLNLVEYCAVLETIEQTETGVRPEKMCSDNFDNIRFNGVYYLLQTFLAYTVYTTNNPQEIHEFIKTNLQKHKCLGIVINLGAYHYTAITKFYTNGNYTYIDSQEIGNIKSDANIDNFMNKISSELEKSVAAIAVMQNPFAYKSKASRLLEAYPWSKVQGFYEITPEETQKLQTTFPDIGWQGMLSNFLAEKSENGLQHTETGITIIKSASNDNVYNALKIWFNYVSDFIKTQIQNYPSYSLTNYYKHVGLDGENDFTKFIEIVNDTNEGLFINKQKNLLPNTKLLPEETKSQQSGLPPPPPPPNMKPQLPPENRQQNLTDQEIRYLKDLYELSVNLAYDLRNFMGVDNLKAEDHTVRGVKLNNGQMHKSFFLNFNNSQQGSFYQKLYNKIAVRDYNTFYTDFGKKNSEPDKWNFIFTWLENGQVSKTPAPTKSKEIDNKQVENEIAQYLGKQVVTSPYISTIFTLLPKILKGEDYLTKTHPDQNGRMIPKETIDQIRKTFKEAIDSLNSVKGGKKTHKLKIKKRKTYRKKLFRHKSRNTINRLKLVRQ